MEAPEVSRQPAQIVTPSGVGVGSVDSAACCADASIPVPDSAVVRLVRRRPVAGRSLSNSVLVKPLRSASLKALRSAAWASLRACSASTRA